MRHGKDLIGKPLITLDEGRFIGNIKDIYVDKSLTLLTAVHLGREGILKRKDRLVRRQALQVIGVDAMLVKNSHTVVDEDQVDEFGGWVRLDDLKGRDVDTPGGTRVGTIGDVLLDAEARIIGFALSRVYVEGPIAENKGFMRSAILDTGREDGAMTIDIALAETERPENE